MKIGLEIFGVFLLLEKIAQILTGPKLYLHNLSFLMQHKCRRMTQIFTYS